jgi:hypothetical protein
MNIPCDSPSNARRNRRFASLREDTIKVTVRNSGPPIVHIIPEIVDQRLWRSEGVGNLILTHVLMIAFASLVVVAQHTTTIHHKGQPILEAVSAASNR